MEGVDKATFEDDIPVYVDGKGAAQELVDYLAKQHRSEKRLVSIVDMPGTGMTVTIQEAARRMGAVYCRLPLNNTMLPILVAHAKLAALEHLRKRSDATGRSVREHMADTIALGLAQILHALATDLSNSSSSSGEYKGEGEGGVDAGGAKKAVMHYTHSDRVQHSVGTIPRGKHPSGAALLTAKAAMKHELKWEGKRS